MTCEFVRTAIDLGVGQRLLAVNQRNRIRRSLDLLLKELVDQRLGGEWRCRRVERVDELMTRGNIEQRQCVDIDRRAVVRRHSFEQRPEVTEDSVDGPAVE